MAKRIAILYEDTGGGHRSTAQAVAQAISLMCPNRYETAVVNGTPYLPFPFDQGERSYPAVVNRARFIHAWLFHALNRPAMLRLLRAWLVWTGWSRASRLLRDYPADVYVSCHPLFSQLLPPVICRLQYPARVAHVVTDLASGHAAHFAADLDACLVPTEQARQQALQHGLPPDKVILTGQPVWPNLRERMSGGAALRASLGLRDDLPVALMTGGGDGMGAVGPTACAIMRSALKLQLIVVCGRNEALRAELEATPARIPLRVLGFVDNMPELMGASDILISKSGTLTLCEGLLAGLPILMYDAIPGQEDGNVDYLTQHGAGVFCPTPRAVVDQLRAWLGDQAQLARVREASLRLAQPDAAFNVAREIDRLAAAVA